MGERPGAPAASPPALVTDTESPLTGPTRAHLDDPPSAPRGHRPARAAAAPRPGRPGAAVARPGRPGRLPDAVAPPSSPRQEEPSAMNAVSQVFAVVAAAIHLIVWPLESFLYGHPRVRRLLTGSTADAPEVRLWRVNVGFYNLFLALGLVTGLVLLHTGHTGAGRAMVLYVAAFMVAGGTTLFASEPKLWRGALGQAVPAAIILLAEAF
ncbi:DUF1304 domain-containing protein [Kitasatospora sp. NPDC005856]|uniref:DUF1304 domain-containing protein n=1 Tax=Kitasatospora sp. NPDC005856 TaxID=3154566 RepID=UPI0033C9ABBB